MKHKFRAMRYIFIAIAFFFAGPALSQDVPGLHRFMNLCLEPMLKGQVYSESSLKRLGLTKTRSFVCPVSQCINVFETDTDGVEIWLNIIEQRKQPKFYRCFVAVKGERTGKEERKLRKIALKTMKEFVDDLGFERSGNTYSNGRGGHLVPSIGQERVNDIKMLVYQLSVHRKRY